MGTSMVLIPSQTVRLLVGGGDGTATMMMGETAQALWEQEHLQLDGSVTSLSVGPTAKEALAVSAVGTCFLVRCTDLSVKVHSHASAGAIYDIAYPGFISDLFLTASSDGHVMLWDANDYSARVRCAPRGAYPIAVDGSEEALLRSDWHPVRVSSSLAVWRASYECGSSK